MKVLLLTPQLPYPPISGGVIKSHKLLMHMAEHYELEVACLLKSAEDEANLPDLQALLPQVNFVTHSLNIPRTGFNFARSLLAGVPLTIFRNRSRTFAKKVKQQCQDKVVIFVDHYLMNQYVPKDFAGRVVVHEQNAEYVMWSRMAEQTLNWAKAGLLAFEAARIRRYEVAMCEEADIVLAAPNDSDALTKAGARNTRFVDTYHLGDEQNLEEPAIDIADTAKRLLFVGTLSWEANVDGLMWFLQSVWPKVKTQVSGVQFCIAGKCPEGLALRIRELAPDVELAGFVDDLEALYKTHRVFVAPLRFGSGIKVKVVNSLYRGLPTVTTTVGAEGLSVTSNEHLLIGDDAQSMVEHVVRLLEDDGLWQQLSEQSRTLMAEKYTWDVVFNHLDRSMQDD